MLLIPSAVRRVLHVLKLRRRFPKAVIHSGVVVGEECDLGECATLFHNVRLWKTTVGRYSYVQAGSVCFNAEVGPFCSVAADVVVGLAAHPTNMVSTSPVFYDNTQPLPRFFIDGRLFSENVPRTIVGADVWIGQGAMIKAGVRIGVGAVIGAGSVVTRDVAPYTIVAGVPSRPIRLRFDEEVCVKLGESRWWELSEQALLELAPLFPDTSAMLCALEAGSWR